MRLIDADELMEYANNMKDKSIDANDIARFPTIDPVKHGHWIKDEHGIYHCSNCGIQAVDAVIYDYFDEGEYYVPHLSKFCGECGAKLDEVNG